MLFTLQDPKSVGNFDGYDDDTVLVIDSDRCRSAEIEKARRYDYDAPVGYNIGMILFYLIGAGAGIWIALLLDSWAPRAAAHWVAAYIALGFVAGCGWRIWYHIRLIMGEFIIRDASLDDVRVVYWDDDIMATFREACGDDWGWVRREMLAKSPIGGAITFFVENYAATYYGILGRKASGISWTADAKAEASEAMTVAAGDVYVNIRSLSAASTATTELNQQVKTLSMDATSQSYKQVGTQVAKLLSESLTVEII